MICQLAVAGTTFQIWAVSGRKRKKRKLGGTVGGALRCKSRLAEQGSCTHTRARTHPKARTHASFAQVCHPLSLSSDVSHAALAIFTAFPSPPRLPRSTILGFDPSCLIAASHPLHSASASLHPILPWSLPPITVFGIDTLHQAEATRLRQSPGIPPILKLLIGLNSVLALGQL